MKILTEICLVGGGLFLLSWTGLIALFTLAWLADKRELRLMHDASPAWDDDEVDVPDFLKDGGRG